MKKEMRLIPMSEIRDDAVVVLDSAEAPNGSRARQLGLKPFDLVTPDGHRVWVAAGWKYNGNLLLWAPWDYEAGRRPGKFLPDDGLGRVNGGWPLTFINSQHRQKSFIKDYLAAYHGKGLQQFRFGIDPPDDWHEQIGRKVYAYNTSYRQSEFTIVDYDSYSASLTLKNRGDGSIYCFGTQEITASWHFGWQDNRIPPAPEKQPEKTVESTADQTVPELVEQYLYRCYSRGGELLYVGITTDPYRRWKQHSKDKPWWPQVHRHDAEWFPDRASVEAAERRAIQVENPKYNIIHKTTQGA